MSVKSIAERERKAYTQLVQSLNSDDATVEGIEEALARRRTIIRSTPSQFSVESRLRLLQSIVDEQLFTGSDLQIRRRVAGELNRVLFAEVE